MISAVCNEGNQCYHSSTMKKVFLSYKLILFPFTGMIVLYWRYFYMSFTTFDVAYMLFIRFV